MTSKPTQKHTNITVQKFVLANTLDWQYRALKVVTPYLYMRPLYSEYGAALRVTDVPNNIENIQFAHN